VWFADGTGQPTVLRGHEHWVISAGFSPDGKRIFTASQDKTVRVWFADGTGEPVVLRGAAAAYGYAAWSPDGGSIAAPSDDHTVWVWTDLEPLRGASDPKLWTATSYCLSIDHRLRILGVAEATARADQAGCLRRVDAAPRHR
jgi:WD40 repeat protein